MIDTYGTGVYSDEEPDCVKSVFDASRVFTTQLNLKRPIYQQTAAYGHFGRKRLISLGKGWTKLMPLRPSCLTVALERGELWLTPFYSKDTVI